MEQFKQGDFHLNKRKKQAHDQMRIFLPIQNLQGLKHAEFILF